MLVTGGVVMLAALITRGAWRVLWTLARTRRFDPPKTDRVTR